MAAEAIPIKILFFAKARELTGVSEAKLRVNNTLSSKELLEEIVKTFSLESIAPTLILALNEEWVDCLSVLTLKANDIVAVIPPLSGGMYTDVQSLMLYFPF